MKHLLFCGLAASCIFTSAAFAAPTNLTASADTSVRGGSYATRAFGNLDILRVRNTPNLEHARKAYLRFDVSALPSPVKSAQSATLKLTVGKAEFNSPEDKTWTFAVYGLKDGDENENWDEARTNWTSAPANKADSGHEFGENATRLGTFTLTGKGEAGKAVEFSSPELLKLLQSDTNGTLTLILAREDTGEGTENVVHIFASKENTALPQSAPVLSVNFDK